MNRFFRTDMPFGRFALNTLVVTCLSLAPLLVLYVALTPGFGRLLLENGTALSRFLRQVLTNGVPVVFTVNYVSFFLYALMAERDRSGIAPARVLLLDLPARIGVFVALHAMIYVLSADWFGSFGGDPWLALRVVGPTLVRSAFFENLSGVYLYATMASAVPLYTLAIAGLTADDARHPAFLRRATATLPGRILLACLLFGLFVLLLTGAAALIVRLQGA